VELNSFFRFQIPYSPNPDALVADAGPDVPGGLGANKGYWMRQLRNPTNGQWMKMGQLVEFHVKLADGTIFKAWGTFEGSDGTKARVKVQSDKNLPDGYYHPEANNLNPRAKARLGEDYLDEKGIDVEETIDPKFAKFAQPLEALDAETGLEDKADSSTPKTNMVSGDAALANIRSTAAKQAKAEGRFPVMRDGKDAERAAEEQYKSIFEAFKKQHPEFNEHFADADEYWSYVKSHAAGTTTNWADDYKDIDPVMRASNQTYAQEILGLEPDGYIEFYRNAVNSKDSQELSAAGYISLDRRMAWDYNSYKGSDNPNDGRYIVRVKPDEVTGALGYSGAEDEFGVVVGPDITSIPGRITRVGDLEIQNVTPYIDDSKTFDRSGGGSPFRFFSTASQFNLYTTDEPVLPGDGWSDFYAANNLETGAIPAKFDELYGAGAFDKAKADFGGPQYKRFQELFVETPDGSYGLDPRQLDNIRYQGGDVDSQGNYERYLKMLSTIQELTGEPFMVSNAHSLDDPRLDPTPDAPKTTVYSSIFDNMPEAESWGSYIDIDDVEDLSEEQYNMLQWFTDGGYDVALQKSLGKEISPKEQQGLDELTKLIESHKTHADTVLWRGVPITDKSYSDAVDNYKPGMIVTSATFNSHSEDSSRAEFYANMDLGSKDRPVLQRVIFRTQVPEGTNAYRIPDEASSYGNSEQEIVFHPDSRYEIINVGETVDGTRVVDMRILPPEAPYAQPAEPEDYKMAHKAPHRDEDDFHKSLDQIDQIFPKDILDPAKQAKLYASGNPEADKEAFKVINSIKGNPDAEVTIYRGVPGSIDAINPGDWVTLSEAYARQHVDSNVPGGHVISMKVKASDIFTNADSIQEWGYDPAETPATPKVEPERPKPAIPTPAMLPKKKPAVSKPQPALDRPSETRSKPPQKDVKAFDANNQIVVKDDDVTFYVERQGKQVEVKGTFLGISEGSLKGKDESERPIIRVKGQDGLKDGDYPIRRDILNVGPGDANFRDTRTPIASSLETEKRMSDATRLTQLTSEQFDAIMEYTTENAFDDIRTLLQDNYGKSLDELAKAATTDADKATIERIKKIEDAIYNSPLSENFTLYRGIEILDDDEFPNVIASLKVGEPVYDASIVSTSSDPAVAEKFTGGQGIIFEIDAPAGTPAFETAPFHNDLMILEDEYMLPRNSEFVITEIGELQDGIVRVKVKYSPPLTRQARSLPTPQLNPPKYKIFNADKVTEAEGKISVPKSPEAQDLASLGKQVPDEELASVDKATLPLFTDNQNYKPFDPGLATSEQMKTLNDLNKTGESAFKYVDSSLKLNKLLRQGDAATEVSDDVKALDEAILISEHLPPGATVYRMMKQERWAKLDLKPGQVIFDRGFMSTTMTTDYVDEELAGNEGARKVIQVPMRIVMPNNTSGISMRPISWFEKENEYLLPRNTGLRFLGWDANGYAVFERVT
jgi:hypothetical protein